MKNLIEYIYESAGVNHDKRNCKFTYANGHLTYFDFPLTTIIDGYEDALEIETLFVDNTSRHKGIGEKLIKSIQEYAKQNNKDIVLTCSPLLAKEITNEDIRLLEQYYERFGFVTKQHINKIPQMVWECK